MKSVSVSLITNKENELNNFLSSYYEKEMHVATKAFKWCTFYQSPLECLDIVTAAVDNNDKYNVQVLVQLPELEAVINENNVNAFVKYIYLRNI